MQGKKREKNNRKQEGWEREIKGIERNGERKEEEGKKGTELEGMEGKKGEQQIKKLEKKRKNLKGAWKERQENGKGKGGMMDIVGQIATRHLTAISV